MSTGNQFGNDGRRDGFSSQDDFLVHNSKHYYKKSSFGCKSSNKLYMKPHIKTAPCRTSCWHHRFESWIIGFELRNRVLSALAFYQHTVNAAITGQTASSKPAQSHLTPPPFFCCSISCYTFKNHAKKEKSKHSQKTLNTLTFYFHPLYIGSKQKRLHSTTKDEAFVWWLCSM